VSISCDGGSAAAHNTMGMMGVPRKGSEPVSMPSVVAFVQSTSFSLLSAASPPAVREGSEGVKKLANLTDSASLDQSAAANYLHCFFANEA
jgi:hypothetical protein